MLCENGLRGSIELINREIDNRQTQHFVLSQLYIAADHALLEMLNRKHVHDIHPKRHFNMHPNNALTMLAVMHPKPIFATSLRRSRRRSRILHSRHFDTLPLCIAAVSRHAIRPRIADVLQRHPLPLEGIRCRRVGKSRGFVRPSVRAGTHGVAGAAGHADAAISVSLGVGEVAWAVETCATICWAA